ncbi:hypothetical protein GPECTOR_233g536 [Gonium pectorale]|uniref:Cysteine-rich DPF motif domain-containing protein 1 n=1 Tax=Gonium pectorale TaxID=33097 RepID=A0A150FWG9_GONPE|nr:hypothetical protein GPECTOR_233g536 [Gonium pectorale]|eukprot:KXZ41963.1 hypothetical protein GPECTOR_233g536 [Gonium pectorale]
MLAGDAAAACRVAFLEEGWLVVDPFSVKARPLLLGAPCSVCTRPVCTADTCSTFYAKRFCVHCAREHIAAFPPPVIKASPKVFGTAPGHAAGPAGSGQPRAAG